MNPTHDGLEKFESHCWKDVPTGWREYEKELVPFDVGELDALALLHRELRWECNVIDQINDQTTYKERFLHTFMFLRKWVLDSDLSKEHFLSWIIGCISDYFQVFPDCTCPQNTLDHNTIKLNSLSRLSLSIYLQSLCRIVSPRSESTKNYENILF